MTDSTSGASADWIRAGSTRRASRRIATDSSQTRRGYCSAEPEDAARRWTGDRAERANPGTSVGAETEKTEISIPSAKGNPWEEENEQRNAVASKSVGTENRPEQGRIETEPNSVLACTLKENQRNLSLLRKSREPISHYLIQFYIYESEISYGRYIVMYLYPCVFNIVVRASSFSSCQHYAT